VIIAAPAIAIVGVFSGPDLPCLGEGASHNGIWAKCSTTHYELLVKKFNKSAPNPKFKDNWDKKLKKYGKGLRLLQIKLCAKRSQNVGLRTKNPFPPNIT
jgi:hypothetical protein